MGLGLIVECYDIARDIFLLSGRKHLPREPAIDEGVDESSTLLGK
jgi:hypothetical protein